jgi:hypothetical protein
MNRADRLEAVAVVAVVVSALLNSAAQAYGRPAADLRRAVGDILPASADLIEAGTLGKPLANCFELARLAGFSMDAMGHVRDIAAAQSVVGTAAIAVKNAAIRLAIVQEALILSGLTLTSREDVDRYLTRMNAACDAAEITAADGLDNVAYLGIVSLHAAIANDLTTRARPLPRIVSYTFPATVPALWLANRLYGGADRTDELIGENKPVHPAFMPRNIRALSQ